MLLDDKVVRTVLALLDGKDLMVLVLEAARHILDWLAVIEVHGKRLAVLEIFEGQLDLDKGDGADDIRDVDRAVGLYCFTYNTLLTSSSSLSQPTRSRQLAKRSLGFAYFSKKASVVSTSS